ncbi:DUF5020 family protein [Plebeiibacterium marinum]|uniref:DUF5020 family protein n=1 Tax=Plebeiibacterium marinum TaxID=2992111 RepID=A0AAE3MF48_9BACT|nr:DUF5020 family protein [Plebeiobacterium marinum]MCW3806823.1 DUF5020 family protein [Plebeiobacterium marinum]
MKKVLVFTMLIMLGRLASAQNVQLHYDFGEDRKMFTTTMEMFKPDKMGSTFFFIDLDYGSDISGVDNGVSLSYWEIARSFKWNENQKFEPRIEFNSGGSTLFQIENAWLVGAQYTFNNADFSKVLSLQANYKYIKDKEDASFQLTAVWGLHFFERKLSFTGFADFWKEEMFWGTDYRFLTEPQIWWNAMEHFSFGGEVELSSNFADDKFVVNPTLAVKWTF